MVFQNNLLDVLTATFLNDYFIHVHEDTHTVFYKSPPLGWSVLCRAWYSSRGIDSSGNNKIDLKNLKYYSCEFRQRLWRKDPADQWWQYSDDPELNIQVAEHIFHSIKEQALPIIQLFKTEPYILDSIEVSDLSNIYKNVATKLGGMILMTTDIRFAWALTKIFEKRNPEKAIQFAKFGLSKLDASSIFIGKVDFERVVRQDD